MSKATGGYSRRLPIEIINGEYYNARIKKGFLGLGRYLYFEMNPFDSIEINQEGGLETKITIFYRNWQGGIPIEGQKPLKKEKTKLPEGCKIVRFVKEEAIAPPTGFTRRL